MAAKRGCVCRRMYYCLILELCPIMAEPEQKKKRILWCCFSSSMIVYVCLELCVYVKWFVAWVGLSLGWLVVGDPFCIYIGTTDPQETGKWTSRWERLEDINQGNQIAMTFFLLQ